MRIAVLSKSDARGGGASVVAERLTAAYGALGHRAVHYHALAPAGRNIHGAAGWAIRALKGVEGRLGFRDHGAFDFWFCPLGRIAQSADAVHLHDMSTTLSHGAIARLARRVPTVWTLHDCSAFTAGCLYPGGCARFTGTCGPCPRLGDWPLNTRFDRTDKLHRRRRRIMQSGVRFTAPSRWMVNMYLSAGWPTDRISLIPNGVDRTLFRPRNMLELREKYGIPAHRGPVLLFSAGWLHDRRKGPEAAAALVARLADLRPLLVLVGRYSDAAAEIFRTLDIAHFGFVTSEAERAEITALCDATLTFSTEENAPLIAIESLASGTPVFGYGAGGLAEMVENGVTGWLAPVGDLDTVVSRARAALTGSQTAMRAACHRAAERYDLGDVAGQYVACFERLRAQAGAASTGRAGATRHDAAGVRS